MTAELSHRERVLRTVEQRDIDRIPLFFRAEPGIMAEIKKAYQLQEDQVAWASSKCETCF